MSPEVSIIVPVYNDEKWIERALRSCRAQSLGNIEVIVVDDASDDQTVNIVEKLRSSDDRIRLVRQPSNRSAFQGRRVGVEAARAPLILFLDGDDELLPEAAETARTALLERDSDVVGFGCVVVSPDGRTGSRYEREMQPKFGQLDGASIIESLFPVGATAQGQLWRYMFKREILVEAYGLVSNDLVLPRVNDLPLAFLTLALAQKYSSISKVLYRYHFGSGASGHGLQTVDDYLFTASAIDSVEAIGDAVQKLADASSDPDVLLAGYRTIMLSVIGRVLHYVHNAIDDELRSSCIERLGEKAGWTNLVTASADYCPDACELLSHTDAFAPVQLQGARHVLLRTGNLRTGGVQGVLVAQARYLVGAGYEVTIVLDSRTDTTFELPQGVDVIQLRGLSKAGKLDDFSRILRERSIDVIIDHHVLYNDEWPFFALLAASVGVPMLAWIHNFALRPVLDGSDRLEVMDRYLPSLSAVVVLSETDVSYWNARGVEHAVYIPNPPSPLLLEAGVANAPKKAPQKKIEIAWWGRLQQSTKQVRELLKIGRELKDMGVEFRLTIIGPDSPDLSASQLHVMASDLGISESLRTPGALHGSELNSAIRHADVFVSASIIEGYPLVLVEAQARGLPIVMYDLPWLSYLQGNGGVVRVPQGDFHAAAREIAALMSNDDEYLTRSEKALEAAAASLSLDLTALYQRLLDGELECEVSPAARSRHLSILLDQSLRFARLHAEREDRALKRTRRELKEYRRGRKPAKGKAVEVVASPSGRPSGRGSGDRKRMPAAVRASGIKAWLQSFLPATMRQTSYFARHDHSTSWARHDELLAELEYVNDRLERLDDTVATLRRATKSEIGEVRKGFVDLGSRMIESTGRESIADVGGPSGQKHDSSKQTRMPRLGATSMGSPRIRPPLRMIAAADQRGRDRQQWRRDVREAIGNLQEQVAGSVELSSQSLRLQEREGRQVNRLRRSAEEIVWSQVFRDTVRYSGWAKDLAVSPGRWAVGYAFLYVLYRALDEFQPRSILELGLGQSTRLASEYARQAEGVSHVVVEHDREWATAFAKNCPLPDETRILHLDLVEPATDSPGDPHRYANFETAVGDEKYDLIVIDGPFGFGKDVARVDILDILPGSLSDSFMIMLDDVNRAGELATTGLIEERLTATSTPFVSGIYRGEKDAWIAVSPDLKFLVTL